MQSIWQRLADEVNRRVNADWLHGIKISNFKRIYLKTRFMNAYLSIIYGKYRPISLLHNLIMRYYLVKSNLLIKQKKLIYTIVQGAEPRSPWL